MPNISGATTPEPTAKDIGAGSVGVAAAHWASLQVTQDPLVNALACFLNLIAQPIKRLKRFPEHEGLIVLMLVASFVVSYFVLYNHDAVRAFASMALSTFLALINYKGDKKIGLNVLDPTPAHLEYGGSDGPDSTSTATADNVSDTTAQVLWNA